VIRNVSVSTKGALRCWCSNKNRTRVEKSLETIMDWDRIAGNWKQVKGKVKEKWGQLTDDDLDKASGRRDQLEGRIQERYGITKDQARKEVDDWFSSQKW
jgi:uncharacterized protein YjbJ (UPF0337 family)